MTAIIDHDEARAAVETVIRAALDTLDDTPEFAVRDPRMVDIDAPEGDTGGVREKVMMADGEVDTIAYLNGDPQTWDVEALFMVRVDAVAGADADRHARVAEIRKAIVAAITANFTLGGQATYAEARSFQPEDLKADGLPAETAHDLTIAVQFVSLSPVG